MVPGYRQTGDVIRTDILTNGPHTGYAIFIFSLEKCVILILQNWTAS